jgi:hypothetical protein
MDQKGWDVFRVIPPEHDSRYKLFLNIIFFSFDLDKYYVKKIMKFFAFFQLGGNPEMAGNHCQDPESFCIHVHLCRRPRNG